jgi:thymidylate synthase
MRSFSFEGINEALVQMSRALLEEGVYRKTPGFQSENSNSCIELSYPVVIEIRNPSAREVKIPIRKWNKTLPYAESLWIALGWNNLDDLPGRYVKNLYSFSDDGRTWRAGYAPRIRFYDGSNMQYSIGKYGNDNPFIKKEETVDQLKYVYETLKKDVNSRQALITIHDPIKDSQIDLVTRDQPCTRSLHFMVVEGKLNLYTTMRSNDLLWGFSAVNNFNFTFMQEYVSRILNIPIGKYYHIAHNFHIYENFVDKVKKISDFDLDEAKRIDEEQSKNFVFSKFKDNFSIEDFDRSVTNVFRLENLAFKKDFEKYNSLMTNLIDKEEFEIFFVNWANKFYNYHIIKENKNG